MYFLTKQFTGMKWNNVCNFNYIFLVFLGNSRIWHYFALSMYYGALHELFYSASGLSNKLSAAIFTCGLIPFLKTDKTFVILWCYECLGMLCGLRSPLLL